MSKIAAAYLRVSTDGQDTRSQRSKIEEYAQANDYIVEKWFVDEALSGTLDDRPALLELKEWVPNNTGKSILMVGIDRLARDFTIYADFSKLFLDCQVDAVYLNCPKVGEPSIDTLLQNILAAFAAYEKDVIRDRLNRGKLYKIKNGIISAGGPSLFGYKFRIITHPTGKKDKYYEINEPEAEVVRRIFTMLLSGRYKTQTIGRELTRIKTLNRSGTCRWPSTSVRSLLTNTTYMGEYRYGKTKMSGMGKKRKEIPRAIEEQIMVKVPAIIDPKDFEKAQVILARLARGGGGRTSKKHYYLLSGLIKCGKCHHFYSGYKKDSKKVKDKWFYYRCNSINKYNNEGKHVSCGNHSIHGNLAESAVWDTLVEILTDPKKIHEQSDKKINSERQMALAEEFVAVNKQLNGFDEEEKRIMKAYGKGLFTEDQVIRYKKELKDEMILLTQKRNELIDQMYIFSMEFAQMELDPAPTKEDLQNYSYENKCYTIQKFISEIKVLPTSPQQLEITFNLPVKPKTVIVTSSNSPQNQEE